MSKPKVELLGADGNIFNLMAIARRALIKHGMKEEAKEVYRKVVENYTFGQAWDLQGWFWKPAEAAKDKLKILDSGLDIDYGNYSSSHLVGQAWKALSNNSLDGVLSYINILLEMYEGTAKEMQSSLKEIISSLVYVLFSFSFIRAIATIMYNSNSDNSKELIKILT